MDQEKCTIHSRISKSEKLKRKKMKISHLVLEYEQQHSMMGLHQSPNIHMC